MRMPVNVFINTVKPPNTRTRTCTRTHTHTHCSPTALARAHTHTHTHTSWLSALFFGPILIHVTTDRSVREISKPWFVTSSTQTLAYFWGRMVGCWPRNSFWHQITAGNCWKAWTDPRVLWEWQYECLVSDFSVASGIYTVDFAQTQSLDSTIWNYKDTTALMYSCMCVCVYVL